MLKLLAMIPLLAILQMPASPPPAEPPLAKNECIVVLHGLGRTKRSMRKMAAALRAEGYIVHNESYPSGKYGIRYLAENYISAAVSFCREQGAEKIDFVTHSMGGILLRQYLADHELPEIGRIVMLAPPNQGTELADALRKSGFFRWAVGPALSELGTGEDSIPLKLPAPKAATGIIAGNRTSDPWFAWCFSGPNDGKVPVERAKLDGMKDFLVVEHGHTFIMNSQDVIKQTIHFLRHDEFVHDT